MDRRRIEGTAQKATGAIKEKVGQLIGSRHTEIEGKVEKAKGRTRAAVGRASDAARSALGKQ